MLRFGDRMIVYGIIIVNNCSSDARIIIEASFVFKMFLSFVCIHVDDLLLIFFFLKMGILIILEDSADGKKIIDFILLHFIPCEKLDQTTYKCTYIPYKYVAEKAIDNHSMCVNRYNMQECTFGAVY